MAEQLVPKTQTLCTPPDLYASLGRAWSRVSSDPPSRAARLVLLAHWALETGFGHACWNWNLGNKKHVPGDGHDYCQFACGEEIALAYAQNAAANNPAQVKIVAQYTGANGQPMASVRFYPPHPACSFVAFADLDSGAADYLAGLHDRFHTAWPFVLSGDVAGFCHALKLAHYFTADEGQYTAGVLRCFHQIDGMIPTDPPDNPGGESGSADGDPEDPLPHVPEVETKAAP